MRLAHLTLLLGLLAMAGLVLAQTQPSNALQNDCRYVKCGVNPYSRVPTTEAQAACLRANCAHCPTILGGSCPVNPPQSTQTRPQCETLCQLKMNALDKTECMRGCQGLPEATAPAPTTTPPATSTQATTGALPESPLYRCYREQCHINPYSTTPWSAEQVACIREKCQNLPPTPAPVPSGGAALGYTQAQCYLSCARRSSVVLQTRWGRIIDPDAYKNCLATACNGDPSLGACTAGTRRQVSSLESYSCNEGGKWVLVNTTQAPIPSCVPAPFPRQAPASAATGRATEATASGGNGGFLQWLATLFGR